VQAPYGYIPLAGARLFEERYPRSTGVICITYHSLPTSAALQPLAEETPQPPTSRAVTLINAFGFFIALEAARPI
jgi:hypothetical protein